MKNPNLRHAAIERVLQQIESRALDLTTPYSQWVELAFALSSLGESGRSYFHRLSRFHPDYDPAECDHQYTRCLESKGSGISLGTFFHLAQNNGISLTAPTNASGAAEADAVDDEAQEELKTEKLPLLPESIYESLPLYLKKVVAPADSPQERDILLLGSVVVLSSCLPNITGIYDGYEVFPNLYLYVTAPASSGKGKLNLCKRLVLPIHFKKRKEAEEMKILYDEALEATEKGDEKPQKPKERMLLLPANSSATGVFQLLADNDGRGLIFESEGDTLSLIFKSDYGNYSDGFRKAFHHETISFYRRTEREYVDLQQPCLSTVLSGTPGQVAGLIPNAENGLFSRFLFYHLELDATWKDTFRNKNNGELQDYFHQLGQEFCQFHELLCRQPPIPVILTEAQQDLFYTFFSSIQSRYLALMEDGFVATVRRMGLICYRLMMVFSALRYQGAQQLPYKITCRDDDFDSALEIIRNLLRHSDFTFRHLPQKKEVQEQVNRRLLLLRALPRDFDSKEFIRKAEALGIPNSSAYRILKLFIDENLVCRRSFTKYQVMEREDIWGDQFSREDKTPPNQA